MSDIKELVGQTIIEVTGLQKDSDEIRFKLASGKTAYLHHQQECCETVSVEDIEGSEDILIGTPVVLAEERTSTENPSDADPMMIKDQDSFRWTFYTIATVKGHVDIRWYGESNGFYSEGVDFVIFD